jgi:hypothetical protein
MAKAKTTRSTTVKSADGSTTATRTERAAKPTAKDAATEKLFKDADQAAMAGLPEDMTVEQRENQVRLGALGY